MKACSYIRTSTALEEQEGSFQLQKEYFEKLITADPSLEYVGCYGDFGKSGRYAERRPEFQRMLRDCEAGKIQTVYTKSVSRFARNITDLVETVNLLRGLGVCVYFERENLSTVDRNTELLLHILGIIAQEESRSFGENVRMGLDARASTGHPVGKVAYGYRRVNREANWKIHEEEARRIRLAFKMGGCGYCYQDIRKALDSMEAEAGTGQVWSRGRLYRTLKNVVYKGDVLAGKSYRLGKKTVLNHGQRPQYYMEEHHEPIITRELFDRVQLLMDKGLLHSRRYSFSAEEKTLLKDYRWMAAQERMEDKGKIACLSHGQGNYNG